MLVMFGLAGAVRYSINGSGAMAMRGSCPVAVVSAAVAAAASSDRQKSQSSNPERIDSS